MAYAVGDLSHFNNQIKNSIVVARRDDEATNGWEALEKSLFTGGFAVAISR
jgi:hypothetical protein